LWIRGTFPVHVAMDEVSDKVAVARGIMRQYPEVKAIVPQIGRPDDGTDPTGFYNVEIFVPLKKMKAWPHIKRNAPPAWWPEAAESLWYGLAGKTRPRTKAELVEEMNAELNRHLPGVDWNFSQAIR